MSFLPSRRAEAALNRLIDQKARELVESTRAVGHADAERLAELQRLTSVAQAFQSTPGYKGASRIPLFIAVAATLAVTSYLLFHRISPAEITLDAKASQITFVTSGRVVLNNPWSLSELSVEEASELSVPVASGGNENTILAGHQAYASLAAVPGRPAASNISMSALLLEPGVRVDVLQRGPGKLELRLTPPPKQSVSVKFVVKGTVQLSYPETAPHQASFEMPHEVLAKAEGRRMVMSFKPAGSRLELADNIPVAGLALLQDQEYYDRKQTLFRTISSIKQATVYQESINGQELEVREGVELHLDSPEGFLGATVEIPSEKSAAEVPLISLRFSGSVAKMTVGHGTFARPAAPTTLEWLAKQRGLSLFWGSAIYVIGLIWTMWRLMGRA